MANSCFLRVGVLASAMLPLVSWAAAPKNDKLSKAAVLAGVSGEVSGATNVGATIDRGESSLGLGQTIWYTFTPPANGYLEIDFDNAINGGGGDVLLTAYNANKAFGLAEISTPTRRGSDANHTAATAPVQAGVPVKLQFDSQTEGAFSFSYRFVTGAAFVLQSPTRGDGTYRWNESEGTIQLTVARVGSTEEVATVGYALESASADVTTDLGSTGDPFTGTLQFQPGQSKKTLSFPITADAMTEVTELLHFTLVNPSAGNVVPEGLLALFLEDSNGAVPNVDNFPGGPLPTAALANIPAGTATTQAGEPAGLFQTIWYTYTATADGFLTVSSDGADEGSLYIGGFLGNIIGSLVTQRSVGPVNQSPFINLTLSPATYVVHQGDVFRIAIAGVDVPYTGDVNVQGSFTPASTFRLSQDFYEVAEGGTVRIRVLRDGDVSNPATVTFATSQTTSDPEDAPYADPTDFAEPGTDYPVSTQTVPFLSGERGKDIEIAIPKDKLKEVTEHFYVRLSSPQGSGILDAPAYAGVYIGQVSPLTFNPYSFAAGLEPTTSPGVSGFTTVKLTKQGGFTASVLAEGRKYSIKGVLPPLPTDVPGQRVETSVHVEKPGLPALDFSLAYVVSADNSDLVTGTVTVNGESSSFKRTVSGFKLPQNLVGRYNIALTSISGLPGELEAPSFLSIDISAKSAVKVIGSLSDGTKVSGTGFLALEGTLPDGSSKQRVNFVLPLYKGLGVLSGRYHLGYRGDQDTVPPQGDGEGEVVWSHPPLTKGVYQGEFTAKLSSVVSHYEVPKGGLAFPRTAPATIILESTGGNVAAFTASGTYTEKGAITFAKDTAGKPGVKIDAKTGIFSGKFTPDGTTKPVSFQGIILRNGTFGTGYFLNGTLSGHVSLLSP